MIDLDDVHADVSETADVCVIGSGAGGMAVARELCAAGASVVMLEEGASFTRRDFDRRPMDMISRMYRDTGCTTALGLPTIPIPLGKTVGGTTTINSGTCLRTPRAILQRWEDEFGVAGATALDPYFDQVERRLNVQPVHEDLLGHNNELVRKGAQALGLTSEPLRRGVNDNCRGCGVCCFGCPSDAKMTAVNLSVLPAALARGLRLYTRCLATRLLVEGGRAVGVEGGFVTHTHERPTHRIRVRAKAVVLAAGSIYSPVFLLRNRVANSSGQVGRNLSLHPATRIMALFDEIVDGWHGVPQGFCIEDLREDGVMLEGIHGPPSLIGAGLPYRGQRFHELLAAIRHVGVFGAMIRDTTRGRVRLGLGWRPVVTYFLGRADLGRFLRGIGLMARVWFAAGARRVFTPVHSIPELHEPGEFERRVTPELAPSEVEALAFHPLGTCRMGGDPTRSVVDPWGASHDLPGLFVADGSVLPSSLGVNPQLTIMAVATRTAEHLLRKVL